jgi:Glycosyltransferase 61
MYRSASLQRSRVNRAQGSSVPFYGGTILLSIGLLATFGSLLHAAIVTFGTSNCPTSPFSASRSDSESLNLRHFDKPDRQKKDNLYPKSSSHHSQSSLKCEENVENVDPEPNSPERRRLTQQTCYIDGDESETCVYDNAFCYDGTHAIMVVPSMGPNSADAIIDPQNECIDYRFHTVSSWTYSSCRYDDPGWRKYPKGMPKRPSTDTAIDSQHRYWLPPNRKSLFASELTPMDVWEDGQGPMPSNSRQLETGDGSKEVLEPREGPFPHPVLPNLTLSRRTRIGDRLIDWVDGNIWLMPLVGQAQFNPFMWLSGVSPLYHAQRNNGTTARGGFGSHPFDGYIQQPLERDAQGKIPLIKRVNPDPEHLLKDPQAFQSTTDHSMNRLRWVTGRGWKMPSIDYIIFTGDGSREISDISVLQAFPANTLDISASPSGFRGAYFNDLIQCYSPKHLLCTSKQAVVASFRPKLFASASDAWMFRQYGYQHAGVEDDFYSHPQHPPRMITILGRPGSNGRGLVNQAEMLAILNETGLEYRFVPQYHMMNFSEQVKTSASTGIFISVHGAALMNSVFLPQNAAVIEIFPPLMKVTVYRNLANLMGLHYFPIYSRKLLSKEQERLYPDSTGPKIFQSDEFKRECIYNNISSYDALVRQHCNQGSKSYPTVIPIRTFKRSLEDAIDAIGAYSLLNKEWHDYVESQQIPRPEYLSFLDHDPDF